MLEKLESRETSSLALQLFGLSFCALPAKVEMPSIRGKNAPGESIPGKCTPDTR